MFYLIPLSLCNTALVTPLEIFLLELAVFCNEIESI